MSGDLGTLSIQSYLRAVSSDAPTPGGGSVASLVGALAASLGSMVTALTAKRSKDNDFSAIAAGFAERQDEFLQLAKTDEQAFEGVMAALRLSKDDASRTSQLESAVASAAETPLATARACLDLLGLLETMLAAANRHCISDIGAAAHLALAALRASLLNVHINITFMHDEQKIAAFQSAATQTETDGQILAQRITEQVLACIQGKR